MLTLASAVESPELHASSLLKNPSKGNLMDKVFDCTIRSTSQSGEQENTHTEILTTEADC